MCRERDKHKEVGMTFIKQTLSSTAFGVFIVIASFIGVIFTFSNGDVRHNGVHPIGTQAVYLAGEACTINTGLDRPIAELRADFNVCSQLHEGYRAVHLMNQMVFTEDEVAEVTAQ